MSIACPHSRAWLQKTLHGWLAVPTCRTVSTTSAINRGLRATREVDSARKGRREGGRDRYAQSRRDAPVWEEIKKLKIKKFTSGGERPFGPASLSGSGTENGDGHLGNGRGVRSGRRPAENAEGNVRDLKMARRKIGYENAESQARPAEGRNGVSRRERISPRNRSPAYPSMSIEQNRGPAQLESTQRVKKYEQVNRLCSPTTETENSGQQKHLQRSRNAPPERKYDELRRIVGELDTQMVALNVATRTRHGGVEKAVARRTSVQNKIHRLLQRVNRKMESGELTKRKVRDILNHLREKIHVWEIQPGTQTTLWFDYANARLELVVDGEVLPIADEIVEEVASDGKRGEKSQRSEKMFTLAPASRSSRKDLRANTSSSSDIENEDEMPLSIPYTTAASTFLYGTNTVLAALQARRRKVYTLYLQARPSTSSDNNKNIAAITALAQEAGIPIREKTNFKLLDRMSQDRPHNGIVLEASALPAPPVLSLGKVSIRRSEHGERGDSPQNMFEIPLSYAHQSAENLALQGSSTSINLPITPTPDPPTVTPGKANLHPLVLMVDGITDPGNLGSLLRSAHFFSTTAVAVATNTCARLDSATVAKASSGACEAIPLLALPRPSDFVRASSMEGWKVYAAVAPVLQPSQAKAVGGRLGRSDGDKDKRKEIDVLSLAALVEKAPLREGPCILMLGAEGEGLRENLKRRADVFVTIDRGIGGGKTGVVDVGVDSLNVSVAGGLLLEAFMRG